MVTLGSSRSRTGKAFYPKDVFKPTHKVEIDGTDVSNHLISATVTRPASTAVGSATIVLDNDLGRYAGTYNGGETVKVYLDYASATNQIFEGTIDKPAYRLSISSGYVVEYACRDYGKHMLDATVCKEYTSETVEDIVIDIITTFVPSLTASTGDYVVATGTTLENKTFTNHITAWDAVRNLADIVEYDFYVDEDKKLHFFAKESIECSTEAITPDNLVSGNNTRDTTKIRNKIFAYGNELEDLPLMKTESDATSITANGTKELQVSDTNAVTMEQVQSLADTVLALNKDVTNYASITSVGLPTLNPGDALYIKSPYMNIDGKYRVLSFTHTYNASGFTTAVSTRGLTPNLSDVIRKRKEAQEKAQQINNKNFMENSYNFSFEDDTNIASQSSTTITLSALVISTGSTGEAISNAHTADANITKAELRITGVKLGESTFQLSNDDGISWENITPNDYSLLTFSSTGKKLKVKINLNSTSSYPNPELHSLAVLYK